MIFEIMLDNKKRLFQKAKRGCKPRLHPLLKELKNTFSY